MSFPRTNYTVEETQRIIDLIAAKYTYARIARELGRTEGAIRHFCSKNGIRSQSTRYTMDTMPVPIPEEKPWPGGTFADCPRAESDTGSPGPRLGHVV